MAVALFAFVLNVWCDFADTYSSKWPCMWKRSSLSILWGRYWGSAWLDLPLVPSTELWWHGSSNAHVGLPRPGLCDWAQNKPWVGLRLFLRIRASVSLRQVFWSKGPSCSSYPGDQLFLWMCGGSVLGVIWGTCCLWLCFYLSGFWCLIADIFIAWGWKWRDNMGRKEKKLISEIRFPQ